MQSKYRFDPKEDLTVLELAEIIAVPEISGEVFAKLPERIKRHFTAQMVFFREPVVTIYENPEPLKRGRGRK